MTFIVKFGSVLENDVPPRCGLSENCESPTREPEAHFYVTTTDRKRISEALRVVIDQNAEARGAGVEHCRKAEGAGVDSGRP